MVTVGQYCKFLCLTLCLTQNMWSLRLSKSMYWILKLIHGYNSNQGQYWHAYNYSMYVPYSETLQIYIYRTVTWSISSKISPSHPNWNPQGALCHYYNTLILLTLKIFKTPVITIKLPHVFCNSGRLVHYPRETCYTCKVLFIHLVWCSESST